MHLLTLNPDTGAIVPGVQLAEYDLGGIAEPSLMPKAGIVVRSRMELRLLPLSASRPPSHENGTLREADLGDACVGQEWFGKDGPKTYNVLGEPPMPNMRTVIAIPWNPANPVTVRICRFPERGGREWGPHLSLPVVPAPMGSGEALAHGPAYDLYELQHHDSFSDYGVGFTPQPLDHPPADLLRVTSRDRDWVVELRPRKHVPIVALAYHRWAARTNYINGMTDRALTGSLL